jgi:hypothetical protein
MQKYGERHQTARRTLKMIDESLRMMDISEMATAGGLFSCTVEELTDPDFRPGGVYSVGSTTVSNTPASTSDSASSAPFQPTPRSPPNAPAGLQTAGFALGSVANLATTAPTFADEKSQQATSDSYVDLLNQFVDPNGRYRAESFDISNHSFDFSQLAPQVQTVGLTNSAYFV